MDITFLGLDKAHWDFINSFANWISAFGTVGAVVVSLWLAFRPERLSLKVTAGVRVVIVPGAQGPLPRYITITAINRGRRLAKVTGIGWTFGGKSKRSRRDLFQMPGDQRDGMSSPIPVMLDDGQQAQWMFEMASWLEQAHKIYTRDWRKTVETFTVEITTSIGQVFRSPAEPSLKEALTAAFQQLDDQGAVVQTAAQA